MIDAPEIIVRKYFNRMITIYRSGGATDETSYYSAFENLMNDIGKHLNPTIICNGQLKSVGSGHPDFGLYSKAQCSRHVPKHKERNIPERGVVEAKGLDDDSFKTSVGSQTKMYLNRYNLVLVTNYREFRLMALDDAKKPVQREFFCLAANEASFWKIASASTVYADKISKVFVEFIKRVMMNAAPLTHAEDVAWFLASYARDALATLEKMKKSTLKPLREALEVTLGIKFEGERGEHFFRSTLIQTLFYGTFSAWAIWAKGGMVTKFDWRLAAYDLTVPMVKSLFEEVAKPSKMGSLGLTDILDRASETLDRIDHKSFFKSFDTGQAIQYFYEPFLEVYDPELRKEMGVWYTPPEIVSYMVERVDNALRTELKIADGLADESVYVLDPCCGTGAFVVEVLRKINSSLKETHDDELNGIDVKKAAMQRIFGFDIMTAPFVIAHWQIGNLLSELNAPLDPSKGERPSVYLTNALTGWGSPSAPKTTLSMFPELEEERDQAEHVKQKVKILVVLGNPPYNAYSGTSPEEEQGLVDSYKKNLRTTWNVKKFNLDDLYIRFFRIAERKISETGRGVLCYISNYSYIADKSFVVARERLISEFDSIWIDCLNGDSRQNGKRTPEGKPDPSVFSTRLNKAGIRVGTAVGMFVRKETRVKVPAIKYRNFWGITKRKDLLDSLHFSPFERQYTASNPESWNYLSFRPHQATSSYLTWPKLSELPAITPINGLMEKRGGALIDINRDDLAERMRQYFDSSLNWSAYSLVGSSLTKNAASYDARGTRDKALKTESYSDARLVRYFVRPFDTRFAYYTDVRPIWNSHRPRLWEQHSVDNNFLISRPSSAATPEGVPVLYTKCLGDNDAQRGHSHYIPFKRHDQGNGLIAPSTTANLSAKARHYLGTSSFNNPDTDDEHCAAIWWHCLAIMFSPKYLEENADGVSIDWPRIPLPDDRSVLQASIALGQKLATLIDTESNIPEVTSGKVLSHFKIMGIISDTNLNITANWGKRDTNGAVMPKNGKTTMRAWSTKEQQDLRAGFASAGISEKRAFELLGSATDVYLNDVTHWKGIPESVWNYYIGGFQVIKKWLSYRDYRVLCRPLTNGESREVTAMVRKIAAIILITDELNANYTTVCGNLYSWS